MKSQMDKCESLIFGSKKITSFSWIIVVVVIPKKVYSMGDIPARLNTDCSNCLELFSIVHSTSGNSVFSNYSNIHQTQDLNLAS